jgi:hypothetical protein
MEASLAFCCGWETSDVRKYKNDLQLSERVSLKFYQNHSSGKYGKMAEFATVKYVILQGYWKLAGF